MRPVERDCKSVKKWLQHHLGKACLGMLTGQDAAALRVFVHLLELYGCGDVEGRELALVAMTATVGAMQPKCRILAKRSIPFMLDWDDEPRIWARIAPGDYDKTAPAGEAT